MDNITEIKEKISKLLADEENLEIDDLDVIIGEIKNIENEDEKREMFNYLVKEINNDLKSWNPEKSDAKKYIKIIRKRLKKHGGLSDSEIDELFNRNEFTVEKILRPEQESKEEGEENSIGEEENIEQEEKEIEKINKRINELENGKEQKTLEELQESLQKLEEEEARLNNTQYEGYKEHLDKKARLEEIKKEKKELQEQIKNAELKENLHKLEEEEAKLNNTQYEGYREHLDKKARLEEIKKQKQEIVDQLKNEDLTMEELQKKLEKLENKKNEVHQKLKDAPRHHTTYSEMSSILAEIEQVKKEISIRLQNSKELENLKEIRDAYTKLQSEAITKFENEKHSEEELKNAINDFVNKHELISKLDKYEQSDKLKEELKESIFENLKSKKIDKKETNKKLLLKGLAAVAGFGTGLVLSSTPGYGAIRMVVAAAKLTNSTVNFLANKLPENNPFQKIVTIKGNINQKLTENKITSKFMKKINKMREKLKSEPLNWFVNGVAAGYIVGNVIEYTTGKTFLEHLKPEPVEIESEVVAFEEEVDTPNPPKPPVDEVIDVIDPSEITLDVGEVVDLSSITEGLKSSTSNTPVSLMNQIGKEVMFDKAVTLPDGKVMWHFKQLNGAGYAWLEAEKVQEVLAKAAEVAKTGSKTL